MLEAAWDHLLVDAEDAADCANFVGRAPYPAFHLLREEECIGLLHAVDKRVTGFELSVCLSLCVLELSCYQSFLCSIIENFCFGSKVSELQLLILDFNIKVLKLFS